ncbi:MAG: hypothetical protein K2X47_12905 [Bdellovibrionales bacterium]|nr:hypothetical protein [Bdellovibrionales bacterium]
MERLIIIGCILLSSTLAGAQSFDSKVPQDIQKQVRDDLAFIQSVNGQTSSPLYQKVFGTFEGSALIKWFNDRIHKIGMNACGNGNAVACVIPMTGADRMYLTQNYIKFSHPQISRLMVLFHEARHTETNNGFWSHAVCPTPFRYDNGTDVRSIWTGAILAGEAACDNTPFGSYGSSTILLGNVARYCDSCNEKVKMDARLYAGDQVNRMTDINAKNDIWNDSLTK